MEALYDAVVIGGGPAGLTAALYLARARYRVLVLEKDQFGGQIAITHEVVNYPGIPSVSGRALTDEMRRQAEAFGAECVQAEATGFSSEGDVLTVHTDRGDLRCLGILVATGAHPRAVGFRGEAEHRGRGVAYCATCDGEFFTGKDVFVIGGGYAAAEESVFLTRFARHVTVLIRRDDFSCAAAVAEQARQNEKITVLPHTVMLEVAGENGLTYARYQNTETGEVTELRREEGDEFGVFVFAGYTPATEWLRGAVAQDEQGYLITDAAQKTSVDGVYAAGDVCIKPLRQVVTATGDGAIAATGLERRIAAVQRRTGLRGAPLQQKSAPAPEKSLRSEGSLTAEMQSELAALFAGMAQPLVLKFFPDGRAVSAELQALLTELCTLTEKLTILTEEPAEDESRPYVSVCRADGTECGLFFHGVPGGHEFTSFVLGLYNAAGPGQELDPALRQKIAAIRRKTELTVLVTLSCTMCPDLVTAAQRIAAENPLVSTHVYDIRHFPALQQRHRVMSVPCLVIDGERVLFGRRGIEQLLSLLTE